jgi:hypothetical protein
MLPDDFLDSVNRSQLRFFSYPWGGFIMGRTFHLSALAVALAWSSQIASGQESAAAKATREKLKQVIDIDEKETGTKVFFDTVKGEMDKPVKFKIDNVSGVSNNSKVTYKGKKVTIEKILNDMSDKYDFGWIIISNAANNKEDGTVVIRKSSKGKERGYEAGKEPKKASREPHELRDLASVLPVISQSASGRIAYLHRLD